MAEPLPDRTLTPQLFLGWNQHELDAYDQSVEAEHTTPSSDGIRFARIVGYLLIRAPNAEARVQLANWVEMLNVLAVGEFIQNYLIRPQTQLQHLHPPHLNLRVEQVKGLLEATPALYSVAKEQALIRDGYRCMACGIWDCRVPDYVNLSPGIAVYTRCAHIVPESIAIALRSQTMDTTNELELDYSPASLQSILRCFGYDIDTITGRTVHSLHNIMTLQVDVRNAFDRLDLWFVATDMPHCYIFGIVPNRQPRVLPPSVTFTSSYPDKLPLPSPELLLLHATCAEVAHLSGTTAYMDKIDLKIEEDADVLAEDGGSFSMLFSLVSAIR